VAGAAAAGLGWGLWVRHYPPPLAVVFALATGAVTYVAFRTWDRVRDLHQPPESVPELAPREEGNCEEE
jgi:hypothetical protein